MFRPKFPLVPRDGVAVQGVFFPAEWRWTRYLQFEYWPQYNTILWTIQWNWFWVNDIFFQNFLALYRLPSMRNGVYFLRQLRKQCLLVTQTIHWTIYLDCVSHDKYLNKLKLKMSHVSAARTKYSALSRFIYFFWLILSWNQSSWISFDSSLNGLSKVFWTRADVMKRSDANRRERRCR